MKGGGGVVLMKILGVVDVDGDIERSEKKRGEGE